MGKFQWDKDKANSNYKKHGVSFPKATRVFDDSMKVTKNVTRPKFNEDRFNTIGDIDGDLHSVIHTPRGGETRLISARRANDKEKKWYKIW